MNACDARDVATIAHWCLPGEGYRSCFCGQIERGPTDDDGPWPFLRTVSEPFEVQDTAFKGCDSNNPDLCACGTWSPIECDTCGQDIRDGQMAVSVEWWSDREPLEERGSEIHHVDCWNERGA